MTQPATPASSTRSLTDELEPGSAPASRGPRTSLEASLLEIWSDVLNLKSLSIDDDFFARGAHSLLASQALERIESLLGHEVPVQLIYDQPTVEQLARELERRRDELGELKIPPLLPQPRTGDAVLSFAQQRLWFLEQLNPGAPTYVISYSLRLRGPLRLSALRRALQSLIERHSVLRARFTARDGEPRQSIDDSCAVPFLVVDLSESGARSDARLATVLRGELERPLDLDRPPLLRSVVVRVGPLDHVVVLTTHHIVFDAWSMVLLLEELEAAYRASLSDETDAPPPLTLQYVDYAAWQRRNFTDAVLARGLEYWKRQLEGMQDHLRLPTDRPRRSLQAAPGATWRTLLPPSQAAALKAVAHDHHTTLYMVLLAALAVLLHRYTGQSDIAVGSPISMRGDSRLHRLIGFFVNSLVLRVRVEGKESFSDLLSQVRQTVLDAYRYKDVPFERIVEVVAPARSVARAPLFQVVLDLDNGPAAARQHFADLAVEPVMTDDCYVRNDLEIHASERQDGLSLVWLYDRHLFDAWRIEQMSRHYGELLDALARRPDLAIDAASLPGGAALGNTDRGTADRAFVPVHRLIEDVALASPHAIAVSDGTNHLSYRELDRRANKLARYLMRLGVRPEVRIGICMSRSIDMFVAVLSTLKAGAAYVPLDPEHPQERIAHACEAAATPLLLVSSDVVDRLPADNRILVRVDADRALWDDESSESPQVAVDPENLAYVMYTSGSTGRPKGVCVTHRGVWNLGSSLAEKYGVDSTDVVLQFASFGFDAATTEWTIAFLSGAKLIVPPRERLLPGRGLEELWLDFAITVVTVPPTVLAAIRRDSYPSLRTLAVAGEACPADLIREWCDGRRFLNAYGPTEITVCASISDPLHDRPDIGRPIANTVLYVLDPAGNLTPHGVVGELYIGGAGIARGYLGAPGQTAERFVPNPYGTSPGERIYRTGDLVRTLPDGRLEFVARADDQLKIRGCRIEPAEVTDALESHPAVRRAVAVSAAGPDGQPQLVAYATVERAVSPSDLIAHTRQRLPSFMVPSHVYVVDRFPLSSSGKLDRAALAALTPKQEASAPHPPRTMLQSLLCEIWAHTLQRDHLGIDEDFFAAGGHSLLAAQAAARVERMLQRQIGVAMFFEHPTVAEFAAALKRDSADTQRPAPPLVPGDAAEGPLSFEQQRLWFLDQLTPGSPFYVIPYAVRIRGALHVRALANAMQALVDRHSLLRTAFVLRDGQPRQTALRDVHVTTRVVDLCALTDANRDRCLHGLIDAEVRRPFTLSKPPLVRSIVVRLAPEEHVWLVTMHHIVSDASSMTVFTREISALYDAASRNAAPDLPPLPVQYVDYAAWQHTALSQAALQGQVEYWLDKLAGATALNLPTDRPRLRVADHSGDMVTAPLTGAATAQLRALAADAGVTLYMVMLAAWQVLLARYSGQTDILVGTPIASRRTPELEALIGFFVNTLVMRTDLGGNPTFRQAIERVRETAVAAYMHQDAPFDLLVEKLQPERDLSRNPVFQVLLQVHEAPIEPLRLRELSASRFELNSPATRFDLELHAFADTSGGFRLALIYSRALFDPSTIARMLRQYLRLLATAAAEPDRSIEDIPLLSDDERELVLTEWNDTAVDWREAAEPDGLGPLVLRQATRTPDRIAMVANGDHLTYGELAARARAVAAALADRQVGPEDRVGVCVPRGLGIGIGMLGVTFAGAAYVPLDPSYPPARLRFMAEDAALAAIVTEGSTAARLGLERSYPVVDVALAPASDSPATRAPVATPHPQCLAYVYYTSGSTGTPKGIGLPHAALLNLLRWYETQLPPAQRTLQLASISFDACFHELFHSWATGGTVICVDDESRRDAAALARITEKEAIEKVIAPALLLAPLTQRLSDGGGAVKDIVCTAEPLQVAPSTAEWFAARSARLHNHYGPSETHVVTAHTCNGPPSTWPTAVPIGRPIANTQLYVLDRAGQPVPLGVVGELYVGGASLARGYFGRPGLTAERFVPDAFGAPGGRLYRTGDRVRYRSGGELEFLGRNDHQLKIRGFRVEPTEVEEALTVQPGVAAAVVTAQEDQPGMLRLVAYVVPERLDAPPSVDSMRSALAHVLPGYMVPAAFVVLPKLPVTPSGKVDRKQLPAPDEIRPDLGTPFVAPRTPTESALAEIWKALLRIDQVGIDDDFFDLGGHSLLAAQFVNRLEEEHGSAFPLKEVFEHRTIRRLSNLLDAFRALDRHDSCAASLAHLDRPQSNAHIPAS